MWISAIKICEADVDIRNGKKQKKLRKRMSTSIIKICEPDVNICKGNFSGCNVAGVGGAWDFIVFSLSLLLFYRGQSWKYIKFWGYKRKVGV